MHWYAYGVKGCWGGCLFWGNILRKYWVQGIKCKKVIKRHTCSGYPGTYIDHWPWFCIINSVCKIHLMGVMCIFLSDVVCVLWYYWSVIHCFIRFMWMFLAIWLGLRSFIFLRKLDSKFIIVNDSDKILLHWNLYMYCTFFFHSY